MKNVIREAEYAENTCTIGIYNNERGEPLVTIAGKAAPMDWLRDKIREVRRARAVKVLIEA